MEQASSQKNTLAIIFKRFRFPVLLVVATFAAAWFIFSTQNPRSDFYVSGAVDTTHIFRTYEFTADTPGTIAASLTWDTVDSLQLRIASDSGKTLVEKSGQSPIELSTRARSGETYKIYVFGTAKDQHTKFILSAANNASEIISQDQTAQPTNQE